MTSYQGDGRQDPTPAETLWALSDLGTPWALRAVAGLRIADLVEEGVTTVAALAARSGADPAALRAILALLVHRGVLTDVDGTIGLTEVGELLRTRHPESRHGSLDPAGIRTHMEGAFAGLPGAAVTGSAAYPAVYGRSFWQTMAADPDLGRAFDLHLATWAEAWAEVAAQDPAFDGVSTVVDVGGGIGVLATAIARAHPEARTVVVEQGTTATRAAEALAGAGLGDRCRIERGDFLRSVPSGADVYVLAQVLHDWDDPDAAHILSTVAAAAPPGATIAIIERLPVDDAQRGFDTMDLLMFALFGAGERSRDAYVDLAATAGMRLRDARPLAGGMWLLAFGLVEPPA